MVAEAQDDTVEVDRPFGPKVETMAGYGLSSANIALVLAIDEAELQSIYQRELDTGALKVNLRVAESLYRQALGDGRQAVTAAIFWLKTRARWKETSVHEITPQGFDLTTWTDDQLEAAIRRLEADASAQTSIRD